MTATGAFTTGAVITAADQNAGGGAAWAAWAPTYTNLTIGNGVVTSKYSHVGRTVRWKFVLTFGTTTSVTGLPTISLPVAAADNNECRTCLVYFADTGTASYYGVLAPSSTTAVTIKAVGAAGTYLGPSSDASATVPVGGGGWASTDVFTFFLTYEATTDGP